MAELMTRIAVRLLVRLARHGSIQSWLQRLQSLYKSQQVLASEAEIPEILALGARPDNVSGRGKRLNLLVPAVSTQHVFGGIATALQVFDQLRGSFEQARIIVTDEVAPQPDPKAFYGGWPVALLDDAPPGCDHIVVAGSRWGKQLAVHERDHFMVTAWWTALNGFELLRWQVEHYPEDGARQLLYLIQDYEPGFYPWSSRYVLAQSTYAKPHETVALINSGWLVDYLDAQGHRFSCSRVLHPTLHPVLRERRSQLAPFSKERLLLVYGRPGTDRNAFPLVVAALKLWVRSFSGASSWRIVSAGEAFDPIDLGHGCQLHSVGKLDIDGYADLLSRTAVGLSLMVSPHPSYPPLEMAAFGVRVVTNGFANKDLSTLSSYLTSLPLATPQNLASALAALTSAFDARSEQSHAIPIEEIDWNDGYLQSNGCGLVDGKDLLAAWLGDKVA